MTRQQARDAWDTLGASVGAFLFALLAYVLGDRGMCKWFACVGVLAALVGAVLLDEARTDDARAAKERGEA